MKDDGYIKEGESSFFGSPIQYYAITFKGRYFFLKGGYVQQSVRDAFENTRLDTIENEQRASRYQMFWLTVILCVASVIAAIYYAVELYWNHGWFHF